MLSLSLQFHVFLCTYELELSYQILFRWVKRKVRTLAKWEVYLKVGKEPIAATVRDSLHTPIFMLFMPTSPFILTHL
jgi:hypothetical protein